MAEIQLGDDAKPGDTYMHNGVELVATKLGGCNDCVFAEYRCNERNTPDCNGGLTWMTPLDAVTFRLKS